MCLDRRSLLRFAVANDGFAVSILTTTIARIFVGLFLLWLERRGDDAELVRHVARQPDHVVAGLGRPQEADRGFGQAEAAKVSFGKFFAVLRRAVVLTCLLVEQAGAMKADASVFRDIANAAGQPDVGTRAGAEAVVADVGHEATLVDAEADDDGFVQQAAGAVEDDSGALDLFCLDQPLEAVRVTGRDLASDGDERRALGVAAIFTEVDVDPGRVGRPRRECGEEQPGDDALHHGSSLSDRKDHDRCGRDKEGCQVRTDNENPARTTNHRRSCH